MSQLQSNYRPVVTVQGTSWPTACTGSQLAQTAPNPFDIIVHDTIFNLVKLLPSLARVRNSQHIIIASQRASFPVQEM